MQKDDNKPFVKISTPIILNIINSQILEDSHLRVWILIYSLSSCGTTSIPIAYKTISKHIGKSYRTVCRSVSYLINNGYLQSTPLYKEKWSINILKCTIPQSLQDICDQYKDRKKSEYRTIKSPPRSGRIPIKDIKKAVKSVSKKNLPLDPDDNYNKKNINININIHNVEEDCEVLPNSEQESLRDEIICKEKELSIITEEFKKAEKEHIEALKSPESVPIIIFELLQKKNRISSHMDIIESRIKFLQKKIDDGIAISKIREKVKFDQEVVNGIDGKRRLSDGLLWWIKKKLHSYGINPSAIPKILNEMVHSVRFGSFSHTRYSVHEEMPLMRSVNCCLKLIREGRWQSPASYQYGNIYA